MIKYFFLPLLVILSMMSCVDPGKTSENTVVEPIDSNNKKIIIVDVRTKEEWMDDGHANCSVNYPLNELESKIKSLRQFDKVVVVCRSGHRAGIAKEILEKAGIKNIDNKGAWQNITCK